MVGSAAPALGGVVDQINGGVAVVGNGTDTLVVDDSGNGVAKVGSVTSAVVGGLSPQGISYSGLAHLNLKLGSAADTLNIVSTAAGTATAVTTGAGANVVNVGAAAGAGNGLVGVAGPVTVTGSGADTLRVSDAGASGARNGTMTAGQVMLGGASIVYSGLSTLGLTFAADTTFAVAATNAATSTTIDSLSGSIVVGGPAAANVMAGVAGALTVRDAGGTALTLNDSADATGRAVNVSASVVSGLSGGVVNYSNVKSLAVLGGNGNDTITVAGTQGGPVTINAGGGTANRVDVRAISGVTTVTAGGASDVVVVGSVAPATGGVMGGIGVALTVNGGGATTLRLDDAGDSTAKTVTVTATSVTGLNPGGVTYAGIGQLAVGLGSGDDVVNVNGTAAGVSATTVSAGAGNDTVNVSGAGLNGHLVLAAGSGQDALAVDDTADQGSGTVTLTGAGITGVGAGVDLGGFEWLQLNLGPNEPLAITDSDPAMAMRVSVPSGKGTVKYAGNFGGQLTLGDFSGGTVSVGGDFGGTLVVNGGLQGFGVGQNWGGTLSVTGAVPGVTVGGDVSGSAQIAGDVASMAIGGSLLAGGSVSVGGTLTSLTIGGRDAGAISAVAVGTIGVANASATDPSGVLLSVVQGGVLRQVRAITAQGVPATSVTAAIAYDGATASVPQAAIRLSNPANGNRFDLLLEAPANSNGFDLTRLKSAGDANANVRNVAVVGNLLNNGLTPSQASYFGEFGDRSGGVDLPNDRVAAVSVTGNMALWSIKVGSIQGIAFSSVTQKSGTVWTSSRVDSSKEWQADILIGTLAVDPSTKKPFATIRKPTEQLLAYCGTDRPAGLFIGKANEKQFVGRAAYFSDKTIDGNPPALAEATYAPKWSPALPVITDLTFVGDGGSIVTDHIVQNVSSTGALGDLVLRGGKKQVLKTLNAPSVIGKVKLMKGGKMAKAAAKGLAAASPVSKPAPVKPVKPVKHRK